MIPTLKEPLRKAPPVMRHCVDCHALIPAARPTVNLCATCSDNRDKNVPAHTD
jgi:RNA polymerase-binding transcription factor DksA